MWGQTLWAATPFITFGGGLVSAASVFFFSSSIVWTDFQSPLRGHTWCESRLMEEKEKEERRPSSNSWSHSKCLYLLSLIWCVGSWIDLDGYAFHAWTHQFLLFWTHHMSSLLFLVSKDWWVQNKELELRSAAIFFFTCWPGPSFQQPLRGHTLCESWSNK